MHSFKKMQVLNSLLSDYLSFSSTVATQKKMVRCLLFVLIILSTANTIGKRVNNIIKRANKPESADRTRSNDYDYDYVNLS